MLFKGLINKLIVKKIEILIMKKIKLIPIYVLKYFTFFFLFISLMYFTKFYGDFKVIVMVTFFIFPFILLMMFFNF